MKVSPLGALFAIVIIGVTIEAIERQSRQAAYALAIIILLGIVTFNASAFSAQITAITAAFNKRSAYTSVGRRTRLSGQQSQSSNGKPTYTNVGRHTKLG